MTDLELFYLALFGCVWIYVFYKAVTLQKKREDHFEVHKFAWGADSKDFIRPLPTQPPIEQVTPDNVIRLLKRDK